MDHKETLALMEPLLIAEGSRHRGELTDLTVEADGVRAALADLVRAMNCYYSNLIEGHDTHPVDIERALKNDYSNDPRKRDLQLEAKAHITVQQWIDTGGVARRPVSLAGIKEIHRRFCELLPDDLLWIGIRFGVRPEY
jgi:Fic family protein